MRKTDDELSKLCQKLKIDKLWSWSRYHTYKEDKWTFFLKYVLGEEEDKTNSIYAISGGNVHDIIEKFYLNKIKYEDMIERYEDELFAMNCAELKYDRNDSEKNDKISNKYENCIRHFFRNHNVITAPHKVEEFIKVKIADNIYMQGYIDFMYTEDSEDVDGNKISKIHIVDWKTSTRYTGEKINKECGQLLIYAEGIRQLFDIPLSRIVCEWNFLKYVTVAYEQANGKIKERHIERNVIGESLVNTVKMWLTKLGYEEDMEKYIDEMVLNNNLECLPEDVRSKFYIKDCYVQIPLTEEKIEELKQDIIETVNEINYKEEEYQKTKDENIFWQDVTENDEYRLAVLSGYSRKKHKPYDTYLTEKEMFLNNDEIDEDVLDELINESTNDKDNKNDSNIMNEDDKEFLDFLNSL